MSKIEWTGKTWNPTIGCTKVSEGCRNCYAEKMSIRINSMASNRMMGLWSEYSAILKFDYSEYANGEAVGFNGDLKLLYHRITQPFHWKKPQIIFVNSMSDLFHEKIPFEFIAYVWEIMFDTERHTYQILTKRPERMLEFSKWMENKKVRAIDYKNVWLGTSIEDQKTANERMDILQKIPAKVRFLSIEPLLEKVKIYEKIKKINWVIVGCESGPKRRPCKLEWVESIVEQCKDATVPVFVKQISINGRVEKNINKFPEHLRIREYPKTK